MFGVVHVIIDVPPALAEEATTFWSAALGWPAGDPWPEHPEFRSLVPPTGTAYVHLQIGDHGPRIHLDVAVQNLSEAASRLVALGAEPGPRLPDWRTLHTPGGLPFCLVPSTPTVVPAPRTFGDGHRLRLVQVCVDIPRHAAAAEVPFWRSASDWRWVGSAAEAFAGKLYPDGASPVQLLLQVLGDDDAAVRTRAHLDLGSDDVEAAVRRLVELGAVRGTTGDGWVVLTDPVGMVFCVTENSPE